MTSSRDPRQPAHAAVAETRLGGTSQSPAPNSGAVASGTTAGNPPAERASRLDYQPALFAPECEWDGTLPVPYGVVPF